MSDEEQSESGRPDAAPEVEGAGQATPSSDERTWAMLTHLLTLISSFVAPLIIWLAKKEDSPFVDDQGKEALNFQITVLLAYAVAGLLTCVVVGFLLLPAVWLASVVFAIIGGIKARDGVRYRYPVALRLLK